MTDPIVFKDVRRSFGGREILSGLSLRVRPGEVFALLGRNAAGKSTALNILLGFLEPDSGQSSVIGVPSRALDGEDREKIGYVAEGHPLYVSMSVRAAIEFEAGTRKRFDRKYVEDALQRLSIRKEAFIRTLSRGQRAQLSLVFAMAGDPQVLVLDDPAMGLDVVMRREFLDAMIDLLGREGRSVLFSSHILSDVERIADRIGVLHGGSLVVDATMDDLKQRVHKRFVRSKDGRNIESDLKLGILRAKAVRDGFELTLVDFNEERESALNARASFVSEPQSQSLEDMFFDFTAAAEPPLLED
jgi:ABC-2 type transport system ATP-binding protein